jgi:multidrug efflux pump subunit AcrA (membrane-fusion protein)
VATIETTGLPLASFNISELDVTKVKQGMKATITIDSIADKSFTGKVVSVDKTGTTSNNVTNYPIIIEFDTQVPELLTNMSTQAAIIIDTKQNVVVIPSAAIQKQNGENTVKIMKDGREQTVVVETGITSDTQTEIISGISEGDIIVTGTTTTRSTTGSQSQSVFGGGGANAVFRGAGGFSTTTRITR